MNILGIEFGIFFLILSNVFIIYKVSTLLPIKKEEKKQIEDMERLLILHNNQILDLTTKIAEIEKQFNVKNLRAGEENSVKSPVKSEKKEEEIDLAWMKKYQ